MPAVLHKMRFAAYICYMGAQCLLHLAANAAEEKGEILLKFNFLVRAKNPWFWIGLVSIAITAMGVDPQSLVSWQAVGACALDVLRNPVQLVTVVLAVLAVFVDPTTSGLCDSKQALTYEAPKKDQ